MIRGDCDGPAELCVARLCGEEEAAQSGTHFSPRQRRLALGRARSADRAALSEAGSQGWGRRPFPLAAMLRIYINAVRRMMKRRRRSNSSSSHERICGQHFADASLAARKSRNPPFGRSVTDSTWRVLAAAAADAPGHSAAKFPSELERTWRSRNRLPIREPAAP